MFFNKKKKEDRDRKNINTEKNTPDDLQVFDADDLNISSSNSRKVEKRQKVEAGEKLTTTEFVVEDLLNKFTKGALDVQQSDFEFGNQIIMSVRHNKRVIQISEFPEYIRASHIEGITNLVKELTPVAYQKHMSVNIIEHCLPYNISMQDKKVKSAERNIRKRVDYLMDEVNRKIVLVSKGQNIRTSRENIDYMAKKILRLKRKVYSFEYIDKQLREGVKPLHTFIFVELMCKNNLVLTDVAREVVTALNKSNYKASDVTDLENYMKEFGLASINPSSSPTTRVIPMTSTTKTSALSSAYEQGMVRTPKADVYIGHEITKGYPAFMSYSESADKFVQILLADSGGGKTSRACTQSLFILNHKGGTYKQVIRDYKGEEGWTKIANTIKGGKEVTMKVTNPKFINTFSIPEDCDKFGIEPKAMYQLCASFTSKVLTILCGSGEKDINSLTQSILGSICDDIVRKAYVANGVNANDPSTYYKSRELDFRTTIWDATKFITTDSADYTSKYDQELLRIVRTSLQPYLTMDGNKRFMFSEEIQLGDIIDSDYIVFNYGLKVGAGGIELAPKDVLFRNMQESFFVRLYSSYNYKNGNSTIYWIEDLQAQFGNSIAMKDLNDIITIGRAINIKPVLILCQVEELFKSSDVNVTALKENINTVTIGRVKDSVARQLLEYLGFTEGYTRSRGVFSGSGDYKFSFLNVFSAGGEYSACITKIMLPKHILNGPLFTTVNIER